MNALTEFPQMTGLEQLRAILVMGCAVDSKLKPGKGYTTLELKVAYHKAITDRSELVRAEGRLVPVGRRAAFADGKLFDQAGALCATATATCLVFEL